MLKLKKIENYMNREDAHGFTLENKTKIMDVLIYSTGFCDVKFYENGKFVKGFQMHRDEIVGEVYKHFSNRDRSLCVYLFG